MSDKLSAVPFTVFSKIDRSSVFAVILFLIPDALIGATQEDGCRGFSGIAKTVAEIRDKGHSQIFAINEMLQHGMSKNTSSYIAGAVYEDLPRFNPDAVEYALFKYCMDNPEILLEIL